jgi:pyrroline-5-carboxylate reductase
MANIELVLIGGGNMGEALLRGVMRAALLPPETLVLVEPLKERREKLARELGIVAAENVARAPGAPRYVLAVKPQQMDTVATEVRAAMGDSALVISIVAGLSTAYLARVLGPAARVVRAMPNTPMLAGAGCTGLCTGAGATQEDLDFAQRLFGAAGLVRIVEESSMDALTAVSGCGPAYFFYLIEAMIEAGVAEGLSPQTAADLARQACAGAAALLEQSQLPPAVLRANVTSPGGVTQAAIEVLQSAGVKETLVRAVRTAAARSRQLGR